jgi:nucleotide-binding universal stress UspA family protein
MIPRLPKLNRALPFGTHTQYLGGEPVIYDRIIIVVNDPEIDACVLTTAIAYGTATHAELRFLQVFSIEELATSVPCDQTRWLSQLTSWQATAHQAGLAASVAQMVGDPVQTISEMARSWDADLVVMCGRELSGRGMQPLTCDDVATYAGCSVLSVEQATTNTVSVRMVVKTPEQRELEVTKARLESLLAL